MSVFCIPKKYIDKIKGSALRDNINIGKIAEMTSPERRAYFSKFVEPDVAKFINTEFEKSLVSQRQEALLDWAKSVFSPVEKGTPKYKLVLGKINELKGQGVIKDENLDNYLEDLVAERLGANISETEAKQITKLAENIAEKEKGLGGLRENFGTIKGEKETIEFLQANREMDNYLNSLVPSSKTRVFFSVIGRGTMLFSFKSPILNIISNTVIGIAEALVRRLSDLRFSSANFKTVKEYFLMVNRIYQKTGYDISRMNSLDDLVAGGGKTLGEVITHSQGKGIIRKVGRFYEDIVFKQLMGAPDVAFSSAHFIDSAALTAQKYSKGNNQIFNQVLEDSMRVSPLSREGRLVRDRAMADAMVATWTNEGLASKLALEARGIFNKASGEIRAGESLFPFIKTPANVIETGIKYAGAGAVKSSLDLARKIKVGEITNIKEAAKLFLSSRDAVRSGVGLLTAFLIASQLKDSDFMGAYDPDRAQISSLKNKNYNAIRTGGYWLSMDWFGPLAPALTGILYAKKYAKDGTAAEKAIGYGKAVGQQASRLPVISEAIDYFKRGAFDNPNDVDIAETKKSFMDAAISFLSARIVPGVTYDIAKSTDPFVRKTDGQLQVLQSKIPGLRQMLPVKTSVLGEDIKTENPLISLFFGSRVKREVNDPVINEMDRLYEEGEAIKITDWDKSSSKTIAAIKASVPAEEFSQIKKEYGQKVKEKFKEIITSEEYLKADDAERSNMLDNAEAKIMKEYTKKWVND